jgi:hypothetical protein
MTLILNGTTGVSGVDGSAATPAFQGNDANTGISFGTDIVTINTGGQARVTTDASGNVGIGTSSPASKLEVTGDVQQTWAASMDRFVGSKFSTTYELGVHFLESSRETRLVSKAADSTGLISFYTGVTPTEKMRINSDGNVGIGQSPLTKLQVRQTTNETSGGISVVSVDGASASVISELNDGGMTFRNTGAERMRIDTSGNLLVGQTSWSFASNGTQIAANGRIYNTSNTDYNLELAGSTSARIRFYTSAGGSGTTVGSITVSGSATTYATSSDYRLKENVAPMTGALATVAALKPVTYTWKADGSDGQGFIAHELQAVVPDCVTGTKDAVDKDGNPQYQGVDTSFLVATLVAAIQELKYEVDALKGAQNV